MRSGFVLMVEVTTFLLSVIPVTVILAVTIAIEDVFRSGRNGRALTVVHARSAIEAESFQSLRGRKYDPSTTLTDSCDGLVELDFDEVEAADGGNRDNLQESEE